MNVRNYKYKRKFECDKCENRQVMPEMVQCIEYNKTTKQRKEINLCKSCANKYDK